MATTIPGSITPLSRGPTSKCADFAFTLCFITSRFITSPPFSTNHPRSFNASPPYCQQPPSASTPHLAGGTGVPPTAPPPTAPPPTAPPPTAPQALRQYLSSNKPTPTTLQDPLPPKCHHLWQRSNPHLASSSFHTQLNVCSSLSSLNPFSSASAAQ